MTKDERDEKFSEAIELAADFARYANGKGDFGDPWLMGMISQAHATRASALAKIETTDYSVDGDLPCLN